MHPIRHPYVYHDYSEIQIIIVPFDYYDELHQLAYDVYGVFGLDLLYGVIVPDVSMVSKVLCWQRCLFVPGRVCVCANSMLYMIMLLTKRTDEVFFNFLICVCQTLGHNEIETISN